jgi:hypothetical protein
MAKLNNDDINNTNSSIRKAMLVLNMNEQPKTLWYKK